MKKTFYISLIFFCIIIFVSCHKTPKCDLAKNVTSSSINVIFKDSLSGKYLYDVSYPINNKDSLKILDPNCHPLFLLYSQQLIPNTSFRYWIINFGDVYIQQTDVNSFNTEICKRYIIQYGYNDYDTLKVCFKSTHIQCGSVFESLKVYYKNQLISTITNDTHSLITILKS